MRLPAFTQLADGETLHDERTLDSLLHRLRTIGEDYGETKVLLLVDCWWIVVVL
jgi:hypothetical protein